MNIFKSKKKNKEAPGKVMMELISDSGNGFYSWHGNLYKSDIVRSIIRPKAKAVGKMTAKHIRSNETEFKTNPEIYIKFLLENPNPFMSGQILQEKMVTQLELNSNAFAVIIKDDYNMPTQIYPLNALNVEAIYENEVLFLKFLLRNGKIVSYPYSDIIHLRKDFNENDLFGTSPAKVLEPIMEVVNTTDQGVVKAIKNSNTIKWLLKFKTALRPDDIKKEVKSFEKNYLQIDSEAGGAAATDSKYDAEQVKAESYVPNAAQMDKAIQRLYSFFNTNEKIIQSKYSEDEWNAYYESEIEPVGLQLSNQYTEKLFTRKARSFGNEIVFEASNLQYASMSTKLNLVQMVDRGSLTPNEWRKIMNLSPIENGDKPVRRLDTAVVEGGE
ncbi:phage portal protein [Clostridioides difficile]|uniref:Phage portal protein n=2 Tax=root TaxID=1 RepID=J9QE83_9CAUD|nr:phage portal protein [Clostridioides difficile]YP_006990557.1 portal protein [Clostridium phage phiMMP04]AFO72139.1 phage portal protein [Clostridium phage phiMMP04]EGT3729285.1 phage portal protein [Clostridioides difficile]EGT3734816.1 phage portal protein [Clostridioides difficile]EGT3772879.1 phage portal protein [Clostridioides difficile]EGT3885221.1 phage portal protein [Clostridioides difficile]